MKKEEIFIDNSNKKYQNLETQDFFTCDFQDIIDYIMITNNATKTFSQNRLEKYVLNGVKVQVHYNNLNKNKIEIYNSKNKEKVKKLILDTIKEAELE